MNGILACLVSSIILGAVIAQAGALTFTKPAAWLDRAPSSTMRVAEYVVPKATGDAEDGELIIYYFGGSGGTVDSNLKRWTSQFEVTSDPVRSSGLVHGLKTTGLDVSGTYIAEVRPGSTERHNKPGFRMRAVVVETPKGPYFIKLTGPSATIAQADEAFTQFMRSLAFKD